MAVPLIAATRAAIATALADATLLYADRGGLIAEDQNLTFPTDVSDAYIHMRFSKYVRRSISRQPFYDPQNSIKLPIPSQLRDSTTLNYSTAELGPAYGAAVEAVSSASNLGDQGLINIPEQLFSTAIAGAAGAGAALLQSTINSIPQRLGGGQTALNALSATTGISINQYQTITFKTPEFKTHSFSWKLIPNNKAESDILERIIRTFKYSSSPSISSSGAFFGYPEILEIRIFPNDEYLYKFKPCVVKSINVNYAPLGPSFYRGTGAPTAIELSIQLQEIELWTKADYFRDINGVPQTANTTNQPNLIPGPRS
jgi:hypothetical protein